MKGTRPLPGLLLALGLASCGKPDSVSVVFKGTTPATSAVQSRRVPEFHCPTCNAIISDPSSSPKVCPSRACQSKMSWPAEVPCAYCGATGACPTCRMMKQEKGLCYNCRGTGALVLLGQADQQMLDQLKQQEPQFKEHYDHHYASSGYGYNQYRPAYQYGYELAMDTRYKSMEWSILELQARKGWDESTMGLWDQYKDAVRFGWERGVIAQRG